MITKEQLQEIADKHPEGFTIRASDGEHVEPNGWNKWVIAIHETQNNSIEDYENIKKYAQETRFIGGWKDSRTGQVYLDAVNIYPMTLPFETIKKIAVRNQQIAIYDLLNSESIYL